MISNGFTRIIRKIIIANDLEKLKKFSFDYNVCLSYLSWSLYYVILYGRLNIFKYLLKTYKDKISNYDINNCLEWAVTHGEMNIVNNSKSITDKTINYCSITICSNKDLEKLIKLYKFTKENNLCPAKYKNTIF